MNIKLEDGSIHDLKNVIIDPRGDKPLLKTFDKAIAKAQKNNQEDVVVAVQSQGLQIIVDPHEDTQSLTTHKQHLGKTKDAGKVMSNLLKSLTQKITI